MKKIRDQISGMREGTEQEFLQDILIKVEQAIKNKDFEKLDKINSRLNGIFSGLSSVGQAIAQDISQRIKEEHDA